MGLEAAWNCAETGETDERKRQGKHLAEVRRLLQRKDNFLPPAGFLSTPSRWQRARSLGGEAWQRAHGSFGTCASATS